MIKIFKTIGQTLQPVKKVTAGVWINVTNPSKNELEELARSLDLDLELLSAPLDREESSRIEKDDENGTMIVVDIPINSTQDQTQVYDTLPLGIFLTDDYIMTICLEENLVVDHFVKNLVKDFSTSKRIRFVMQLLYRNAAVYLRYLRQVDRLTTDVEVSLHRSMNNKELFRMMALQKSLVYFSASLKQNQAVLDKLLKVERIGRYSETDADYLEDAIVENKQAIEMVGIYTDTLNGTMDAFASIIANNQNDVMKFLAGATILLNIPAVVFGFYGMNTTLPGNENGMFAYAVPIVLSLLGAGLTVGIFVRRGFFK
jgi:magnesium transporter